MKTISVNVPDAVYQDLLDYARRKGQTAEDLVRAAVELTRQQSPAPQLSVLSLKPLDLGKMLRPANHNDLLDEMLHADGH